MGTANNVSRTLGIAHLPITLLIASWEKAQRLPFDAGVPLDEDRLAGVPVLVAQGDQDHVIPRPLLDRTWTYLHDASGAVLTAHRDPGGTASRPAPSRCSATGWSELSSHRPEGTRACLSILAVASGVRCVRWQGAGAKAGRRPVE